MDYKDIPEDYVQIVKIIENGYKGSKDKMIGYMNLYLEKYPNGVYSKLLKSLFDGNDNPDGLCLDANKELQFRKDKEQRLLKYKRKADALNKQLREQIESYQITIEGQLKVIQKLEFDMQFRPYRAALERIVELEKEVLDFAAWKEQNQQAKPLEELYKLFKDDCKRKS